MNIVHIFDITLPHISGGSIRSQYIIKTLKNLNAELTAYSSPILEYANPKDSFFDVSFYHPKIPAWPIIKKFPIIRSLFVSRNIEQSLLKNWDEKHQIIHAHSPVTNGLAGLNVSKKKKVPFIYEVRFLMEDHLNSEKKIKKNGLWYTAARNLETKVLKQADHITTICEGLKKDIVQRGIPEHKISIIQNAVDADHFTPQKRSSEISKKYQLNDSTCIGFIGSLWNFEGLECLIHAASEITKNKNNIKFMIVGNGQAESKLKQLVKKLNLDAHFIFTGRVAHDNILKYYSVIDIFVYPRVSQRITELITPLKPLEAMALKKIVIGSNVGGIKELIENNVTGFIFPSGDHHALAELCLSILNNEHDTDKIKNQAYQYILDNRQWKNIGKKYLDIYHRLILTGKTTGTPRA